PAGSPRPAPRRTRRPPGTRRVAVHEPRPALLPPRPPGRRPAATATARSHTPTASRGAGGAGRPRRPRQGPPPPPPGHRTPAGPRAGTTTQKRPDRREAPNVAGRAPRVPAPDAPDGPRGRRARCVGPAVPWPTGVARHRRRAPA